MVVIDTSNNILITRGDTATIDISIKDETGQEYNLQTGDVLLFSVKRLPIASNPVIEKTFTNKQLILSSADTDSLSFGTYKYDITLITASGEVCTFINYCNFFCLRIVVYVFIFLFHIKISNSVPKYRSAV